MIRVLALCAVFAAAPPPASARDAKLAKVSGTVSILFDGGMNFTKAVGGEDLLFGDTILVGKGGVAHLVLPGRGAVLLREETLMKLEGSRQRTSLSFAIGEFLIGLHGGLKKGQSFKVRTPSAVAAVRGTLFWGKTDDKKTTTYAGLGRRIAVTAKGKTVIVDAGQTVTVAANAPPTEPKPHDIPRSYWPGFGVDGDMQGVDALMEKPKP